MPDPRAELFAAMEGRTKPKPRSRRAAASGPVRCTDACPPPPDGCLCKWGCWIHDGAREKVHHIRLSLVDWTCPIEHSDIPGEVAYRKQVVAKRKARQALRDDPAIVRPMNGGTS